MLKMRQTLPKSQLQRTVQKALPKQTALCHTESLTKKTVVLPQIIFSEPLERHCKMFHVKHFAFCKSQKIPPQPQADNKICFT